MRPERTRPVHVESPTWAPSTAMQPRGALAPYAEAVRAHTLLALLVLGATVLASVTWLTLRAPEYSATAEIFVTPLPAESVALVGVPLLQDLREPTRTIQTAAALVDSHVAATRTANALGAPWTRERVERAVSVEPRGETNILAVEGVADRPELAARIANTFAASALEVRRETLRAAARRALPAARARQAQLDPTSVAAAEQQTAINRLEAFAAGSDPTLSIAQTATPPASAQGPPGWLVIALAIFAGSLLGIGAAVLMDRITPARITNEDELLSVYPLPILARIPVMGRPQRGALTLDVHPEAREALRSVQVQLDLLTGERPRTVMITSPSPSDGKTTTALSLGVSIADAGARVILIDTDVRRLPMRTAVGADQERTSPLTARPARTAPGTLERPSLRPLLRRVVGHPNLQLLDAVEIGFDSADPHSRSRFADLVRTAAAEADYVLLDTPPIGVISDPLTLLDVVDEVLLVARIRSSKRLHVESARDLLARAGVTPAGWLVIGERTLGSYPYPIVSR